jgi:hypothetical protein
MKHEESVRLLLDYAEGGLDSAAAARIEKHLWACDECRDWVQTYQCLSQSLDCLHEVSAELLAKYAVEEDRLGETERDIVRIHVEKCRNCREELEIIQSSLAAARQRPFWPTSIANIRRIPRVASQYFAAAAAIIITVFAAGAATIIFGTSWLLPEQRVQHRTISGEQIIEGDVFVVIESTEIQDRASLTVYAQDTVVFGDGFSVESGASLIVGTGPYEIASNVDDH